MKIGIENKSAQDLVHAWPSDGTTIRLGGDGGTYTVQYEKEALHVAEKFEALNLFDQQLNFQEPDPTTSSFARKRILTGRVSLDF